MYTDVGITPEGYKGFCSSINAEVDFDFKSCSVNKRAVIYGGNGWEPFGCICGKGAHRNKWIQNRYHPSDICVTATDFEGSIMAKINGMTQEMKEELEELARARTMPITFDEDCPETTPERAVRFKRVNPSRQTMDSYHI